MLLIYCSCVVTVSIIKHYLTADLWKITNIIVTPKIIRTTHSFYIWQTIKTCSVLLKTEETSIVYKQLSWNWKNDNRTSYPKSMSCQKTIVVITGRAHSFHDYICTIPIRLLWDFSTLCVVDHLNGYLYTHTHIYYTHLYIQTHINCLYRIDVCSVITLPVLLVLSKMQWMSISYHFKCDYNSSYFQKSAVK